MRLMKFLLGGLLAVFALFAGLLTAAAVAVTGIIIVTVRRSFRRGVEGARPRAPGRVAGTSADVIEVTATEIPSRRGELQDQEAPFPVRASRWQG